MKGQTMLRTSILLIGILFLIAGMVVGAALRIGEGLDRENDNDLD